MKGKNPSKNAAMACHKETKMKREAGRGKVREGWEGEWQVGEKEPGKREGESAVQEGAGGRRQVCEDCRHGREIGAKVNNNLGLHLFLFSLSPPQIQVNTAIRRQEEGGVKERGS